VLNQLQLTTLSLKPFASKYPQLNFWCTIKECVSVIIPAFEVGQDICESIDSALNQINVCVEVIVVDNGGNTEILRYLRENYEAIRIAQQPIKGAGPARNMGVQLASFELIAFLDAGDVWMPNKLSVQLKTPPEINEISGCYAAFQLKSGKRIGTSVRTSSDEAATEIVRNGLGVPAITSSWCLRKSTFLALGGFDARFQNAQDLDFLNRLVQDGGRITVHRQVLVDYRLDSKSLTVSHYRRQFLSAEFIRRRSHDTIKSENSLEKFLAVSGCFPSRLWFSIHAGRLFRIALLKFGEGARAQSLILFLISFTLNPQKFLSKMLVQSELLRRIKKIQ
jgi:glycosyltransferase involved in cell wall biosynthesis